jgi:hypothetical protein
MTEAAEQAHQEMLELISALSDDKSSDRTSLVCSSLISILNL